MKTDIINRKTILVICALVLFVMLINYGCSTDERIFYSPSVNVYILYCEPCLSGTHLFFCKDSVENCNKNKDYLYIGGMNKSLVLHFNKDMEDAVFDRGLRKAITEKSFSRKSCNGDVIYLQGCIHNIYEIRNSVFNFMLFNPGLLPYKFPDYLSGAPFSCDAFHSESLSLFEYIRDGCIKEMEPLESKRISLLRWKIQKRKLRINDN